MHAANFDLGVIGANGIVGGSLGIAAGAGLSAKMRKSDQAVVCFFGDGAFNQGIFHEAVNLASVWKLPVIFVCENNQYAMSTATKIAFHIKDFSLRAKAYGIPGTTIDGNEVLTVYQEVSRAVSHARAGQGPTLLIAETYRWKGHSRSDAERYRPRDEVAEWRKKCPIERFKKYLSENKILTEKKIERLEEETRLAVEAAVQFAEESPFPSLDTLEEGVYAS